MRLKVVQTEISSIIAVAAGKGGVGKSALTVLLAAALKRSGSQVGILDADLYGPSIRYMLPEERMPLQIDQPKGRQWLPAIAHGIKFFSYSFFSEEAVVRAPVANQVLRYFLENVFWGTLDWLLIDFPPGTGDIPLTVAQKAALNGAVIVTTPQKVALLDVKKTIEMFRKVKVPILGIVENMSYFKEESCSPFNSGTVEAFAMEEGMCFLGKIPLDPKISAFADEGKLLDLELACISQIVEKLKYGTEAYPDPLENLSIRDGKYLHIVWKNGANSSFRATELQRCCPCAQCKVFSRLDENVQILKYEKIGRYALGLSFSSGCSNGIFSFDLLKRMES
jgi:ATP-binding protein involved in chromosome partitioning